MIIGVTKESLENENRVALDPGTAGKLVKSGLKVQIEKDAGVGASFANETYENAGAKVVETKDFYASTDIFFKINAPTDAEVSQMKTCSMVIGLLNPYQNQSHLEKLCSKKITAFSLELLPRISRAQSMDVLSSQASLAGYKAVLMGAATLGKYFPMMTTAAGTMPPSKVLVVGAGVAGLQAIATAKRLGAIVEAYDIRPEVKEQIESLGAKAVTIQLEENTATSGGYAKEVSKDTQKKIQDVLAAHVQKSDVVITTAQVPGKKAPRIITETMIDGMSPGSVVLDMAAEQGGNCAYSKPGETVHHQGITILGPRNLPATMPIHASLMYAKNISTFLKYFLKEGAPYLDFNDEIISASCVTHEGINRLQEKK